MNAEEKLIQRITRAIPSQIGRSTGDVRLGIGDDAATVTGEGGIEWVITCDNFISGVHFLEGVHPAESVGFKALVRAASDVVAMGAKPHSFLMALTLPGNRTGKWLDSMLRGVGRAARLLGMKLIGGDTTKSETVSMTLTVLGQVAAGQVLTRSGARAGDRIYVSGTLGRAQLGLELLRGSAGSRRRRQKIPRPLLEQHLYPRIHVELGSWLARNRVPSAMMDLSDGLSTDLGRLCEASGVGAKVWAERVPMVTIPAAVSKGFSGRVRLDPLQLALHGGDDYELLFTVPKRNESKLQRLRAGRGREEVKLTCIGEVGRVTAQTPHGGNPVMLVTADGKLRPLISGGWDPFRE